MLSFICSYCFIQQIDLDEKYLELKEMCPLFNRIKYLLLWGNSMVRPCGLSQQTDGWKNHQKLCVSADHVPRGPSSMTQFGPIRPQWRSLARSPRSDRFERLAVGSLISKLQLSFVEKNELIDDKTFTTENLFF